MQTRSSKRTLAGKRGYWLRAVLDKLFSLGEDLFYQFLRCRFGINPQQRLGAGGAKKNPGIGSVPMGGGVEEELHSVEVFFLQNLVMANTLRSLRTRPLNGALLHLFGNVKIAAPVVMG